MKPDTTEVGDSFEFGVLARNGATAKGAARVEEILKTATDVLVRNGHAGLTLESVARLVGIKKGNLQYYFPTRSLLLQAVFARQIEEHQRAWLSARSGADLRSIEQLKRLIAFEIEMNRDEVFVLQMRERWSLENQDNSTRILTNRWYAWVTNQYASLIGEIRTDLDEAQAHHLAMMVYSMLIGSVPYYDPQGPMPKRARNLGREMEKAILQLVRNFI